MRSRLGAALVIVLLAAVINLPVVQSAWQRHRIESSGTDVTATVVDDRVVGGDRHLLSFRYPDDLDPDHATWEAEVDANTYDDAVASGDLRVRVLEDDPSAYRPEGAVDSRLPLVLTLAADVVLVLLLLLLWRYGGRTRPQLRAIALADVESGAPEVLLERIHGEDFLVRGEVVEVGDDRVVLDLGNRTILVLLDGHANPVGQHQPAQVQARLIA
jgi:hypothetical protein